MKEIYRINDAFNVCIRCPVWLINIAVNSLMRAIEFMAYISSLVSYAQFEGEFDMLCLECSKSSHARLYKCINSSEIKVNHDRSELQLVFYVDDFYMYIHACTRHPLLFIVLMVYNMCSSFYAPKFHLPNVQFYLS